MEELLHSGIHWNLINFSIFVGLLFFFLRKPVKEFWASREGQIRFEIQEAEQLGREAKSHYEEARRLASRLETDAKELTMRLEREGEMEKKQLMEEGTKRSERLKEDVVRILDQEMRKTREFLKEQTATLALETAESMIRDQIQTQDQKKLSDEYLAGLERQAV